MSDAEEAVEAPAEESVESPAEGAIAEGGAGEALEGGDVPPLEGREDAPMEGDGPVESALPAGGGEANTAQQGAADDDAPGAEAQQVAAPAPKQKKKEDYDPTKLRFERGLPGRGFLPYYSIELKHSYGWETQKRNNLHRLGETKLLTSSGTSVLMFDLETKEQTFLVGIDAGGIGAITVHPTGNYFAVGERQPGGAPNVYIYEFPSLKLVSVLRNGTERAFSDLRFSNDGEMLATVGSMPDYLLHIWDWKNEAVTLRAKAFSQEVFNVIFSPRFDGTLYTSGTGHIRFWKMADTFTGLKLQGEIGKFGAIELSDISSFVELKDGKVVTGSECGNLLLWDGGLVKVEIKRKGGGLCHQGMVEMLWQHGDHIVSAGVDGYLRFWDYTKIDLAEPEDDEPHCHMEPAKEYRIVEQGMEKENVAVKVKTMHLDPTGKYKEWLVQDDAGGLWRINNTDFTANKLLDFHAGSIVGSDQSPVGPYVASAGSDGSVRLHNIDKKKTEYSQSFPQACTCLHWAPAVVDENTTTVVVGFNDGVVRVVQQLRDCWHLAHVIKPHTKAVTCTRFSPDGKFMASCSPDGLLWFQSVTVDKKKGIESLTPVGFFKCKEPLISLAWSFDSGNLMACSAPANPGAEGEVLEFTTPDVAKLDTSTTYDISANVAVRAYVFEKKVIEVAKPVKDKKDGDDDDQDEEESQPEPEVIPHGTPLACIYISKSTFLVTYDGPESKGIIYECSFNFKHPIKELETHKSPVNFLKISQSGRFLLSADEDGTGALRGIGEPLPDAAVLLSKCWRGNLHGLDARVSGLSLDLSDSRLVSSGVDGNIFLYDVLPDFHQAVADCMAIDAAALKAAQEAPAVAHIKAADELSVSQAEPEDIVDPKHYSIQQEKIQAEEDRRLAEAEKKKAEMRAKIEQIRLEFEKLVETNAALPPAEQLTHEEFEVDPDLRLLLEKEAADKVEEARKELQWESEKKRIGLEKLCRAFIDDIAVEHIKLKAFRAPYTVQSFRTKKLTPEQRERIDSVHSLIAKDEANKRGKEGESGWDAAGGDGAGAGAGAGASAAGAGAEEGDQEFTAEELEEKGVPKGEIRKILRQQRQRKWKQLLACKPDDKYEHPQDVAGMEDAKKHMGDYKLKTADNYKVPEHLRINAEKKRRQMVLLEESLYSIKMSFNDRFLALRDLKVRMKKNMDSWSDRIKEINEELDMPSEDLWRPELPDSEFPEKRFEVSQSELDAETASGRATRAPPATREPPATPAVVASADASSSTGAGKAALTRPGEGGFGGGFLGGVKFPDGYEMSEVEKVEAHVRKVQLQYEKEKLVDMIEHTVEALDEAVRTLRQERFKLDVDLKMTDLRMLVLFQELKLLKDFEKRDTALVKKLDDKGQEKREMAVKMGECRDKIAARKLEIDKLNPKQVLTEFTQVVPETNKFHEQLLKIFKKKIKRQKKKAVAEGEEGADGSEEEEEEEEDMSDLDEEEEEEEEDFCPPGCEPALFEQVCELREKRLDQEEMLADFQKAADALKREQEALTKKEKIIDQALKQTDEEIQQFQTFKQQKLNEISVVITLKMHQIKCVLEGKMPPDLSHTIVFTSSGLKRLRQRIDELKDEKEELRKNQKQLRKEHVLLSKSRKVKEAKLKELEARARDVQMLKFGQEVDLEVLEKMSVNKTAEDLKEQLKKLEQKNTAELKAWQKKIEEAAAELAAVTKQNTDKLERVAELTAAQHRLERELNGTQSRMVVEVGPSKEKMKAEREQLVSLVKLQAREMEALKAEINMLRRKGGHVYTPVVRRGHNTQ